MFTNRIQVVRVLHGPRAFRNRPWQPIEGHLALQEVPLFAA